MEDIELPLVVMMMTKKLKVERRKKSKVMKMARAHVGLFGRWRRGFMSWWQMAVFTLQSDD